MSIDQKLLANQIKEDLQKDLEKTKKGEKNEDGNYNISWRKCLGESCSEYRGNEWRLTFHGSLKDETKYKEIVGANGRGWIYVFPEELKPNDWKEIESLIQQIDNFDEEKRKREKEKQQKEQAKIDQILSSNPKHFFYEGLREWNSSDDILHTFLGIKMVKDFD